MCYNTTVWCIRFPVPPMGRGGCDPAREKQEEADSMAEHPIQSLMSVTMDKIRQMTDSNTIIGKPITTEDGTTILPVSKVSFGFASAGTDFDGKNAANKDLFGGGSGAGVNIQPVAFLVIKDGCVRTIQLSEGNNTLDRALTMVPELIEKVSALLKKDEEALSDKT